MKKNLLVIFGCFFFCSFYGQGAGSHPTIDSVKVAYKSIQQATVNVALGIQVIPQATLSLKGGTNATRVYFRIKNAVSGATLYDVNYNLNAATVTDLQGRVLFQNNSGTVLLSSGQDLVLKPYTYEIKTEDNQQNQSPVFSILQ